MSFTYFRKVPPVSRDKLLELEHLELEAKSHLENAKNELELENHLKCLEHCREITKIGDDYDNNSSVSGTYLFYEAYLIAAELQKKIQIHESAKQYAKLWAEAGLEFCDSRKYSNANVLQTLYKPQFNKILNENESVVTATLPKSDSTDDEWSNGSESSGDDFNDEQECVLNI